MHLAHQLLELNITYSFCRNTEDRRFYGESAVGAIVVFLRSCVCVLKQSAAQIHMLVEIPPKMKYPVLWDIPEGKESLLYESSLGI